MGAVVKSKRSLLVGIVIGVALLTACTTGRWPAITTEPSAQHIPGRWVWAELFATDLEPEKRFYSEVFGWRFEAVDTAPGAYELIYAGDRPIGGAWRKTATADATQRSRWLSVMSVTDVDEVAAKTTGAGGKVMVAPRQLSGRGRAAVLADPEGARFGVLHSETGDPVDAFPALDTWLWHELWARNPGRMAEYYRTVGGYSLAPQAPTEGREEIFLEAAGYPRAAIVRTDALELPSAWLAYVRVADLAATLAKVEPAGGEILVAPDPQIRDGRVAIIRDPLGAALGIAQWSVEEEERQ